MRLPIPPHRQGLNLITSVGQIESQIDLRAFFALAVTISGAMMMPQPAKHGLLRTDYAYVLPPVLIASAPADRRGDSRLLVLDGASGGLRDGHFGDLAGLLRPGDLLVRNVTRVLAARLHGQKSTGGAVEILVERITQEERFYAQVRSSKGTRSGQIVLLPHGAVATVVAVLDGLTDFRLDRPVAAYLELAGQVPLPPYIDRAAVAADRERYQTVYGRVPGAVAAPTAGLHFDEECFARLQSQGVDIAEVTLHVGAGTFQPIRTLALDDHQMHAEWLDVPATTVAAIERTKAMGGRVIAIGTTVVRSLETAAQSGRLQPYTGETRLFIRSGYQFRVVDAMVTNFHLSESTLLMLVCAFAGREQTLAAYNHAVAQRYRFFSYGDAMFVTPRSLTGKS